MLGYQLLEGEGALLHKPGMYGTSERHRSPSPETSAPAEGVKPPAAGAARRAGSEPHPPLRVLHSEPAPALPCAGTPERRFRAAVPVPVKEGAAPALPPAASPPRCPGCAAAAGTVLPRTSGRALLGEPARPGAAGTALASGASAAPRTRSAAHASRPAHAPPVSGEGSKCRAGPQRPAPPGCCRRLRRYSRTAWLPAGDTVLPRGPASPGGGRGAKRAAQARRGAAALPLRGERSRPCWLAVSPCPRERLSPASTLSRAAPLPRPEAARPRGDARRCASPLRQNPAPRLPRGGGSRGVAGSAGQWRAAPCGGPAQAAGGGGGRVRAAAEPGPGLVRADGAGRRHRAGRRLLPVLRVRQQPAAGAAAAEQPLGGALRRGTPAGARGGGAARRGRGEPWAAAARLPRRSRAWRGLCCLEAGVAGRCLLLGPGAAVARCHRPIERRDATGCPRPETRLR